MTPKIKRVLVAVLLLAWCGAGCTLLGLGQKKAKTTGDRTKERDARDPDSWEDSNGDDEQGVRQINQHLKKFRVALKARDFDYATKWLSKAVKQTHSASEITKGHPDFEDLEMLVERSRRRLDIAIETDRIERRNAAIDDLIYRGDLATGRVNGLYANLAQRVPTATDIRTLDDLINLLAGLKTEGSVYLDDDRYAEHALDRDEKAAALQQLRKDSRWLADAMEEVSRKITTAYRAAVNGHKATELKKRIKLFHQAGIGFKNCAATIGELEREPLYDPLKVLGTRLGDMSIVDTKSKCLELSLQARQQVSAMTWYQNVDEVVQSVNAAVARLRAPTDATVELEAARETAEVLDRCHLDLDKVNKQEGHDAKRKFETLLGELSAVALDKACTKEKARVIKTLPQIEWRTKLATVQTRLDEVATLSAEAADSKTGADKVAKLEQAIGGLSECQEESKALGKKKGADRDLKVNTAFGKLTINAIEKLCLLRRKELDKDLAAAVKQRDAEGFAKDATGDEKNVIQREGVPSRIETFAGGRIFIYERFNKRGTKALKRYGFDDQGRQVDYWVTWRNEVVGVVSEISRVLGRVDEADTATAMFEAVEAAMPVLDICKEALTTSLSKPGYDPKAFFTTPLGKLTAEKLIGACAQERERMVGDIKTIRWHSRAEALRNRIEEVQGLLTEATTMRDPGARIKAISSAAGGLAECVERAGSLPEEPGANPDYKMDTVYGELTIADIKNACATMLEDAKDSTKTAQRDMAISKFVANCRGDEVEVAWREGIPDKVITFGPNRVFVYELPEGSKATTKRYAFDAAGKRISEAAILADLSVEPEIVEVGEDGGIQAPEPESPESK